MIPKQLFFIWIGNNKPSYVDFAINTFKEVNFDFDINFIHIKDIDKTNNDDVLYVLDKIKNDKDSLYYKIYNRPWAKYSYKNIIGKYSNITDCLKFYYVNKYGGIYLDCDTFPVKPFDSDLLSNDYFYGTNQSNNNLIDYYFMGSQKGKLLNIYENPELRGKLFHINYPDTNSIHKNKQDFYNCSLKYSHNINNNYIIHFFDNTWKKK